MKTITIQEFEILATTGGWKRSQKVTHHGTAVTSTSRFLVFGKMKEVHDSRQSGWAAVTHTKSGVKITYAEQWEYSASDPEATLDANSGYWKVEGVRVIGSNGREMIASEIARRLPESFELIDYRWINKV